MATEKTEKSSVTIKAEALNACETLAEDQDITVDAAAEKLIVVGWNRLRALRKFAKSQGKDPKPKKAAKPKSEKKAKPKAAKAKAAKAKAAKAKVKPEKSKAKVKPNAKKAASWKDRAKREPKPSPAPAPMEPSSEEVE